MEKEVENGTIAIEELADRVSDYVYNEDLFFEALSFIQCYTPDVDSENFIDTFLKIIKDSSGACDVCDCIEPGGLECHECPNYESECDDCQGDKKTIEDAYDKRALLIRSLQFPYHMNLDLIYLSNGLSDKDFIERLLSYLKDLENIYGDMSTVDGVGKENEDSVDYWKDQCRQLEEELENTRCNHEDDYDEMVANVSAQRTRIDYLNSKFDFFVNALKNNISFNTPFYIITNDDDEIIAICLTNGEAIDRAASINAGSSWSCNINKTTLLKLCEEEDKPDYKINAMEILQSKFDDDCDGSDNIIAIRQRLFT